MIFNNRITFLFLLLCHSILTLQNGAYITPYGRLYCDETYCYQLNGQRFRLSDCKRCRPITSSDGSSIYIEESDNNESVDNTIPATLEMEFDRTICYSFPPTMNNYKISAERTTPCQKLKYYQYYYYNSDFYLDLPEKKCYTDKRHELILFLTDMGWCDPSCRIIRSTDSNANCA